MYSATDKDVVKAKLERLLSITIDCSIRINDCLITVIMYDIYFGVLICQTLVKANLVH